jgi:hypothetical protein
MVTRKGIHAKWMPFLVPITGYGYDVKGLIVWTLKSVEEYADVGSG